MKRVLALVFSLFIVFCSLFLALPAHADQIEDLNNKINEYQSKLTELSGQKKTLSSTLAYLNTQIYLTQSQIAKSEQELILLQKDIDALTEQIGKLNLSLDELTALLTHRVRGTYIQAKENLPLYILLSSNGVTDLINRYKYLQVVQGNDKKIMVAMERSRQNYDLQKTLKEQKQTEVETLNNKLKKQKTDLATQQAGKKLLLEQTQNDERKYQQLIAEAIAELGAIRAIIGGKGTEIEVKQVNNGENIASIYSGDSVCSSGTHLHLETVKNQQQENPSNYLKTTDVTWDLCGWFGCDTPFGFSGNYDWPINNPIRITQGFGMTAYARAGSYGGRPHTGIDMVSTDLSIKSIKSGKLYRGSYEIKSGCRINGLLRYVKVDHGDNFITYYLHVNY